MNRNFNSNSFHTGYSRKDTPTAALPDTPPGDSPGAALAIAYVPSQPFERLFSPAEAWEHGTLFQALDLPYFAEGGHR